MTYTWHPSRDYLDHSNVARLMRTLGVTTADELRARSVADIGAFWDTVVHDLGIEFRTPYSQVVDLTRGTEYPEWFTGGTINIVDAALRRWKDATPGATAIVHEAEDGTVRRHTFAELDDQVTRAIKDRDPDAAVRRMSRHVDSYAAAALAADDRTTVAVADDG